MWVQGTAIVFGWAELVPTRLELVGLRWFGLGSGCTG